MTEARTNWRYFGARSVYLPDFLDGFDRLVAFDAETTGKRTPDAEFIRRQPFALESPWDYHRSRFRRNAARRKGLAQG
jgi:hypothetical protein